MAICEVCGEEVAPGDMVVIERKSQPHFFCSTFHRDDWIEADESPGRTRPVTKEEASEAGRVLEAAPANPLPEEPKVKARVVATGHKVTAAEMKAREAAEKAAAKDAEQPAERTVPPVRRRTRKKS